MDPAEGSAFLDWGSHGCDLLRWLVGLFLLGYLATPFFPQLPPELINVLVALIFFGGSSLFWFAVALSVGIAVGSWSSIGVAPTLLPVLTRR